MTNHDWDNALLLWTDWLQSHPEDAHAHHQKSLLCQQLEQEQEALRHLLKALQLAPHEPLYYDSFSSLLRQYGIFKPAWCRNLGNFYHQQGQLEQAFSWYQQGQQCEPQNPEWWRLQGQVAYQLGLIEKSLRCFQEFQRFYPDDPNLLYNLGSLYFMIEAFRPSWQYYLRAYWRKTEQLASFALDAAPSNHPLAQFHDYLLSCAMSHFLNGRALSFQQLCQQILTENPAHSEVSQVSAALGLSLI